MRRLAYLPVLIPALCLAQAFEVAAVKPSNPDGPPQLMFRMTDNRFLTANTSLGALILWAYDLHPKQVEGVVGWQKTRLYDVVAKASGDDQHPSRAQFGVMLQKLLADRFGLRFHIEQRQLAVYTLTLSTNQLRIQPTDAAHTVYNGGSMFFKGLGQLPVKHATLAEFATVMGQNVMDRPVIDRTGLTGRYDFDLIWTPDSTQFGGRAPRTEDPDAPPDLFAALEKLGLHLESTRAQVPVFVIDHAEEPTEN